MNVSASDNLGEIGEAAFAHLCAQAGLICNKSGRDRSGWDYVVQFFPECDTSKDTLDQRVLPLTSLIQVKAVFDNADTVKFRLSSAERILKFAGPSYICVPVIDRKTSMTREMFFIHLLGQPLCYILKSLRQCSATDSLKINQNFLRFKFRQIGINVCLDKEKIKTYLSEAAISMASDYIEKKKIELSTAGYSTTPLTGQLELKCVNGSEFGDIMLGIKPGDLNVITCSEKRFNISLQKLNYSGPGTVFFKPYSVPGELRFQDKRTRQIARIDVDTTASFPVTCGFQDHHKIRANSSLFDIVFSMSDRSPSLIINPHYAQAATLAEHLIAIKIYQIISSSHNEMDLRVKGILLFKANFSIEKNQELQNHNDVFYNILTMISEIVDKIGSNYSKICLSVEDVDRNLKGIHLLHALINYKSTVCVSGVFIVDQLDDLNKIDNCEVLLNCCILFTSHYIAFSAIGRCFVSISDSINNIQVKNLDLREIDLIPPESKSFMDFCGDMSSETGIHTQLVFEGLSYVNSSGPTATDFNEDPGN